VSPQARREAVTAMRAKTLEQALVAFPSRICCVPSQTGTPPKRGPDSIGSVAD